MSRILIIDDERRLVDSLTRALRARGLEADGAYDGERGLELALGGTYALVVLDLRLPKLNGVEVLRATMKSRPEQPVLVLSALEGVAAKVRCLEAGALGIAADEVLKVVMLNTVLGYRLAVIPASRRVQSPRSTCTPALAKAARVPSRSIAPASLTLQVRHQSAVK